MDSISLEIHATKIVWYIALLVVIIGVIGNVLSFAVCSRPNLKNTVFSVYFRFVATVDTITLVLNTFLQKFINYQFNFNILTYSNDVCRLFKIVAWVLTVTSAWTLAIISLDRYISIAFPTRVSIRKNMWFQLTICFLLLVKDLIYYGQLFFSFIETSNSYDNSTNQTLTSSTCQVINYDALYWMDLFNMCLVPSLIMFICTYLILKLLYDSKKSLSTRSLNLNKTRPAAISKRQQKLAITSLSLNVFFLVINVPMAGFQIFAYYVKLEEHLNKLILSVVYLLYYSNFSFGFYINVWVNSIFRKEFFNMFKFKLIGKQENQSKYVCSIAR
jgi:hypothetical protein